MEKFIIESEMIRLGQLLKAANLVSTGGEAKMRIQSGEALVNGEVETRRGRQLHNGDQVELGGNTIMLVATEREL